MSCFSLTEFFGDIFISWLPLYYEAKLLLLFYLVHPQTAGALKLYDQVFRPDSADAHGTPDTRSRVRTRGRPARRLTHARTHAINASLSAVPPKHASTSLVRTRLLLPGESAGLESIHCGVLKCANSAVQFIQPTLQHHEAHIDRSISEAQASAQASWKLFAARGRSKLDDSA